MKKALLFGSTGFIGSHLLEALLHDPDYGQVLTVVRKDPGLRHGKLKVLAGDYASLPALKNELVADEVFLTLGTTQKNTPDPEEYYRIDHDYPVLAATLARTQGAQAVFLVTAVGADADSKFAYVKAKGETERDILALGFPQTHLFRPSMILGSRKENRPREKALIAFWPLVHPLLIGGLSKYRGMDGKDIAKAMARAGKRQGPKVAVYHWEEMKALLKGGDRSLS